MWLGGIFSAISDVPTLERPLRDLIGLKSHAALFEIQAGSWFRSRLWTVLFPKTRNDRKSPDLEIEKSGIRSAVECKRITREQWEEWAEQLGFAVLQRLRDPRLESLVSFNIEFEPRLSDINSRFDEINCKPDEFRRIVADEIADRVVREILSALPITDLNRVLHIPGIALVKFFPDRPQSQRGVGGIRVSPHAKLRKILQNAVIDGARQLVDSGPGVIVVYSDCTPEYDLVEVMLRALNRADASLLGSTAYVAIVSSMDSPVLWRNPGLNDHPVSEALSEDLKSIFLGADRVSVV
jgi:hypothetical protein